MVGDGELGPRLRAARTKQGVSLRAVASATGISASLLSQVENGKTQPSVSTLYSIVSFLDLSIDTLLGNVPAKEPQEAQDGPSQVGSQTVQRRQDAPRIEMQNGVVWERLAVGGFNHVDPLLTTYEPGGASAVDGRFMRHAGIEYGYIIEGELTLKLEFDSYVLRAGDSLCFDSHRPHLYVNESDTLVRGLWFVLDRNEEAAAGSTSNGTVQAKPGHKGRKIDSAVDVLAALDERRG